ncbi:MAG TPA: serine/threonine-protein kinase [Thermoanaerobaculia bacterium]|nr:serine/threonine-protein kinase [Thermoanaerobaculia bacterium]
MSALPTKNPTRLGRYEILDEIGKGAMGVVYLAKDPLIGRLVALKTFRIGYSVKDVEMEQFRARFMREAQSAGILSHPNIVTIHDVVEQGEEGMAFIAMEYVRGTNLKILLQREPALDLSYIAGLMEQIADGLDYAHSKGVVHRDVKPANIIITADNRVKITDFGIARIDTSNLTQEGQLLGTPNYMAPEQILGREVDHRADIFSLGVMLYEMLTRHKPFQGENLTVVSHRIVYDHFTPPKDYVVNLERGIEPILTRALEKDPGRRYQRAREMANDLSRLVRERMTSESLNETLSLSSTMAVAPTVPLAAVPPSAPRPGFLRSLLGGRKGPPAASPPAAAIPAVPAIPAATEAGSGTGTGSGTAGSTPAPSPPPPAAAPRGRSPWLAPLLGGAALLLLVAAAAAVWLWMGGRPARRVAVRPPAPIPAQVQRPVGVPPPAAQTTEMAAQTAEQARQKEIEGHLERGRQALSGKRYDEAVTAATSVLDLAPGNADAQGILNAVTKARTRQRERLAAKAAASSASRPAEMLPPVPQPTTSPAAMAPVPTDATLSVNFLANLPEGILVVYVNHNQVMKESFNFWKKTGWLRREPRSGWVRGPLQVPVGTADIRIIVTSGGKTQVKELSGNFPGGSTRILSATLNEDGSLTARLE